jgi:hypothetical protein
MQRFGLGLVSSLFILSNNIDYINPHSYAAFAVSGGGKDYATKDIRETDFSGQALRNKDFTQASMWS